MIAVLTLALSAAGRRALPWLLLIAAIALFLINARRAGERAGRAAEQRQQTERINNALRRMLEASTDRPRDRSDLAQRMRDGRF